MLWSNYIQSFLFVPILLFQVCNSWNDYKIVLSEFSEIQLCTIQYCTYYLLTQWCFDESNRIKFMKIRHSVYDESNSEFWNYSYTKCGYISWSLGHAVQNDTVLTNRKRVTLLWQFFTMMCSFIGLMKLTTTVYHPQTNRNLSGKTE